MSNTMVGWEMHEILKDQQQQFDRSKEPPIILSDTGAFL